MKFGNDIGTGIELNGKMKDLFIVYMYKQGLCEAF